MMTTFSVNSWSFFYINDRTIEDRLFGRFSVNSFMPYKQQGKSVSYDRMIMWKRADIVTATALSLAGIQDMTRPLPYGIQIPPNLLTWDNGVDVESIQSAPEFFAHMLQDLYGVKPKKLGDGKNGVWIIVDPHLLPSAEQSLIAAELQKEQVFIIIPEGQVVPSMLRPLTVQDRNRVFSTNARAPFADPALEEGLYAIAQATFNVVGAGLRLMPTLIGISDFVLFYTRTEKVMSYEERRNRCTQAVAYAPLSCHFNEDWYGGEPTVGEALTAYLKSWDYTIDPLSVPGFETQGGFQIAPLFVPA